MNENLKATGILEMVLRDSKGNVKDQGVVKNLVVTTGRQHIADQLADASEAAMGYMSLGDDGQTQVVGDSALVSEISGARQALTSKAQGTELNKVVYIADWGAGEGTGAIREAGIFNAASGGVMLCRTTFDVKNKGAGDSLTLTWTITISG